MIRIANWILSTFAFITLICCCGKPGNNEQGETPSVPTVITAEPAQITATQEGGSFSVKLTSPARPKVSSVPDWISYKDGTYNSSTYQMTVTLSVRANESTTARTAELTFSAKGVADIAIAVSQEGKEDVPDPNVLPDNLATRRTAELGLGWNMGNQMDAISGGVANETCWGNPKATQATFDGVKNAGFSSVRIPITWQGHIGAAPDYTIEIAWINRVAEIIGYAEKAGLNVIINTHHDENHGDSNWLDLKGAVNTAAVNAQIKEEIAAVWTQIAEKFKTKGDFLMFESFNELIYGNEWSSSSNTEKKCNVINEWNQVFVDAVRATGGNNESRWLGVPGYAASPNYLKYLAVPNDPAKKTMLAFHCYDPYDYTIGDRQLPDWGHTGSSYPRGEEEIKNLFKGIYENYIAKDIPIYMGEFGCSFRAKSDAKPWAFFLYYLEYVVKAAKTYGIAPFLWDNGAKGSGKEKHAYIDHGTGQYVGNSSEPVNTMVKAWKTDSQSYTLQKVYDSAPRM